MVLNMLMTGLEAIVRKVGRRNNGRKDTSSLTLIDEIDLADIEAISENGVSLEEGANGLVRYNNYRIRFGFKDYSENDIYNFTRELITNYSSQRDLEMVMGEIDSILNDTVDEGKRRVLETSKTLVAYRRDYVASDGDISDKGFQKYLFGVEGALTKRRLEDMKKTTRVARANRGNLSERKNYSTIIGGNSWNSLNFSYTSDENGRTFVNVNHDASSGMSTEQGDLYWDSLDQVFGGNVNTKATVTKYVKMAVQGSYESGNSSRVSGLDWKLNKRRNYFGNFK